MILRLVLKFISTEMNKIKWWTSTSISYIFDCKGRTVREKCYLHNHWSLRYNNLCEEKKACLNSCINLFYCKINSFFTCTDLIVLCIWIWPMIIIQQLFFFHTIFPRNLAEAKINEVGWEQNIRKQYNNNTTCSLNHYRFLSH